MNKPVFVLQSPIWTRSGYGDLSVAIAKSLLRYDKFDLKIAPTVWGACSKKNLDSEVSDPEGRELLGRIMKEPLHKQPEVFMQITIPNEYSTPGKFNIGYTAGIETTVPRPEWIEGLNRMNLNLVTSVHARDVFAGASYNKQLPNGTSEPLTVKNPMEVLFWGADTNIYKKTDKKNPSLEDSLKNIPEAYCFLFVGQWTSGNMSSDRKAIGFLIKTFMETFANTSNPPALILKTSGAQISVMDRYECIGKINEVVNMVKQALPPFSKIPNVYLLHGELDDIEMNALYNHEKVKTHVSFTHGEGFGHPLLLATMSGKPLLTSNWSGHLDFLNPKFSKFFEGSVDPIPAEAINDWFVKEARWFNVDYAAAGQKMRYYFNNYNGQLLSDAESLRIENEEKFSLHAMDKAFHAMLDKYVPAFATEESIKLPKLKKLNLPKLDLSPTDKVANIPQAFNGEKAVDIVSGEPSVVKTTVETTLTKV